MIVAVVLPGLCSDWSPQRAAEFLDARQKEWFGWPTAKSVGGPCVSCHTGLTYLLARPALRRALGEKEPTSYERGLQDGLRARLEKKTASELSPNGKEPFASQKLGVEAILSALLLTVGERGSETLSPEAKQAFDRLWSLQIADGKAKGSWQWFNLDLDPWETPDSAFYGASLAALAAGYAPSGYRRQPDVRKHIGDLTEYLLREQQSQPLHNRLALLWASSRLPEAMPESTRESVVQELLKRQQPDGGWTLESLGSWGPHPEAPPSSGSNSYATAFAAFVLEQARVPHAGAGLKRSLDWLRSRQDRERGYWSAGSMNKPYDEGSMQIRFMQDAATGFASLALLESR
jgi:squalene-hopene/tetraprenyl-beta-curcumene cyclase